MAIGARSSESSGELGFPVYPRISRRALSLPSASASRKSTKSVKTRVTMESSGKEFAASPHTQGRALSLHQNLPLSPCHTENKSSLSGRLPEAKDCVSSESSGELGFSVPPRTHRRSSLHRPRPDSSPQTVLSNRTTNCPFRDETSVTVEGSDERLARRQRKKISHGELRTAGLFRLPTHTRLTSCLLYTSPSPRD